MPASRQSDRDALPAAGFDHANIDRDFDRVFDQLVRRHATDLYRYAYWLARDRQRAEDAVQEALLRGWRAFPTLRDRSAVKSWLFSIIRNEVFRRHNSDKPIDDACELDTVDLGAECASLRALEVREALHALPASYAEPLALQILGGFSCAEIATMLATTEGAVMTRLTRARQALKRMSEPQRVAIGGRS